MSHNLLKEGEIFSWNGKCAEKSDPHTPVGQPGKPQWNLTFCWEKKWQRCESFRRNRDEEVDGENRDREVEDGELRSILPSLSQEDEWKAWLSASFYILSFSLPLLPRFGFYPGFNVCVCVYGERPLSEQQEYIITQTKGAGLLFMNYQPSKANKGPYFHRKLHFHFSSHLITRAKKIKRPLRSQRPKGIHSSFSRSFNATEKVSLLLSFQDGRQMGF